MPGFRRGAAGNADRILPLSPARRRTRLGGRVLSCDSHRRPDAAGTGDTEHELRYPKEAEKNAAILSGGVTRT